jgi:NADH-quinone oxidoreductase subunit N
MQHSLFQIILTILPTLLVALTAIVALVADLFLENRSKAPLVVISHIGLIASMAVNIFVNASDLRFSDVMYCNLFSGEFNAFLVNSLLIAVAGLTVMLSGKYLHVKAIEFGEYYSLLLLATSGAMLMAVADNLILVFVGLEVLSISLYILTGLARKEQRSHEAALKYFLLGAFASAFFLYGVAMIYGGTGLLTATFGKSAPTINYAQMGHIVHTYGVNAYYGLGLAFLLVGLFFKAAIVPFHVWSPDVYEGAPTPVTGFMSIAVKIPTFVVLYNIVTPFFSYSKAESVLSSIHVTHDVLVCILWAFAAITMVIGNAAALRQKDIKRMLAFSSIAHAGYLLMALLVSLPAGDGSFVSDRGLSAIIFYLIVYAFMNLGAFGVVMALAKDGSEPTTIEEFKGLGRSHPKTAAVLTIFLLSLAGIPPTGGFFAKLFLFIVVIKSGYTGLAVLGLLASVIGAAYYLRVAGALWMQPAESEIGEISWTSASRFATAISVLVVCVLFVFASAMLTDIH